VEPWVSRNRQNGIHKTKQRDDEHPSQYLMRLIYACYDLDPHMKEESILKKAYNGLKVEIVSGLLLPKSFREWSIEWPTEKFDHYLDASQATRQPKRTNVQCVPKRWGDGTLITRCGRWQARWRASTPPGARLLRNAPSTGRIT